MSENRALAVIDDAAKRGAMIFIGRDDCANTAALYKAEVTVMQLRLPKERYDANADVYEISGKYMPKREVVDRIGEASGISFLREGCRVWTEPRDDEICGKRTVYIAEQQAKRRASDGSWRESSVQTYEFDPVLRAMDDYNVTELTPQTKQTKNRSGKTLAKAILEFTKVARQRAETGARLRVIRELTGMPTAFSKEDASRPLTFGRFAQNTDYILSTPEGRAMATAQALGQDVSSLFGNKALPQAEASDTPQIESAQPQAIEASVTDDTAGTVADTELEQEATDTPDFAGASAAFDSTPETFDSVTSRLHKTVLDNVRVLNVTTRSGNNPYQLATEELQSTTATLESRQQMLQKVNDFIAVMAKITTNTQGAAA